ncbi:MAG TPA: Zn-dependent hydrolase [Acidimicrobiia bacterium]|nr:Zn-dependent hydrolase [Acidimicrobiia bacterium]
MPADPAHVVADLLELRSLTSQPVDGLAQTVAGRRSDGPPLGSARLAWTEPWVRAREWFASTFEGIPVDITTDPAGNLWVTLRGARPDKIVLGSHLDSVPNGGWLDGCLGVLAGAEVLRALHRDGVELPVSVSVVDWADEEGARFGRSLFGSGAVAGTLDVDAVSGLVDNGGQRLAEVVSEHGVELSTVMTAGDVLSSIVASAELHIEQGPLLEAAGLRLAALHGILGVERRLVRLKGQACHAGATPIPMRRDPTVAAARMAVAVRDLGLSHDAFTTVGVWRVHPSVPTAVNGRTEFSVDMRHLSRDVLDELVRGLDELVATIAAEERVESEIDVLWSIDPIAFHPELVEFASDVVETRSGVRHVMPSGPMHDSAEMSRAGIPTVMLFTPSKLGLSHTHIEDTDQADIELGVAAFDDLVRRMIPWAAERIDSDGGA